MSHDIMAASADLALVERLRAELARAETDRAAALASRDQALAAESAERARRVQIETELGTAQAEIGRLSEVLRHAARMFTIMGARKVIAQALDDATVDRPHRRKERQ